MARKDIDMNDLESAIMDAWLMSELACQFINIGLGFENAEAPKLSNREALLVNFAVIQTTVMMEAVKKAFYGEKDDALEGGGRSEPAGVGEDAPHPRRGGSGRDTPRRAA
jgi:hypothetical protein